MASAQFYEGALHIPSYFAPNNKCYISCCTSVALKFNGYFMLVFSFYLMMLNSQVAIPLETQIHAEKENQCQEIKVAYNFNKILTKHGNERFSMLEDFALKLKGVPQSCFNENDIKFFQRKLFDDDATVVFWSATIIGNIGPRAKSSAPYLRRALKRRKCEIGTVTAADGIRVALEKMGESSNLKPCDALEK